jgi:hypothetical protein
MRPPEAGTYCTVYCAAVPYRISGTVQCTVYSIVEDDGNYGIMMLARVTVCMYYRYV